MAQHSIDGLCFNCPEKFSRDHLKHCTGKGIYLLKLSPDDDSPAGSESDDDLQISLVAITGIRANATLQLVAHVRDAPATALVDSSLTHSFIDESLAHRLGLIPDPRPGLSIGVANGDRVSSSGLCKAARLVIDKEFTVDLFVIPLGGFGIVLGCGWLRSLGPILWDFTNLTMVFWRHDHRVLWRGVRNQLSPRVQATTAHDFLTALFDEFADLFAEPKGLPPSRTFDHRIHLLPGTSPVAVRPYRYAQLLKDEIEAQCKAMLAQGIIRQSTSAVSSPVLLVRKSDGSWQFCVDYRALNNKTVRDKFPIPIIEELLDELKGAVFFTKLDLRSGYHQVCMHPDDIAKTAFRTHHGHFEFLVMPFGLTSAPSTFQALMNAVLQPFLRRCVFVFFEDILV